MPDQDSGQSPSGNADSEPLPPSPSIPTIEQRVMALESKNAAQDEQTATKKLLGDVKTYEWWMIGIQGLTLIVTIAIACIYTHQLEEMRTANGVALSALAKADQNSIEATNQFYAQLGHYDDGLGRTGLLAVHAGDQAEQAKRLANSAKISSDTATEALHISQRAYLRMFSPTYEFDRQSLGYQLINDGHIPTGK